jgi:hypothetical protein
MCSYNLVQIRTNAEVDSVWKTFLHALFLAVRKIENRAEAKHKQPSI